MEHLQWVPQYPLDRRLGWPQNWSGNRRWEKNSLLVQGIQHWLSIPRLDTTVTELPWLLEHYTAIAEFGNLRLS